MSREALVLLVCCCDFRDGADRLIPSKSLGNAVIRAFPGLFRILRMCAPRHAAAVVRPRERKKSADRRRRILISRLLIIRASVPRRKSPFPAYFKGFPAVSLLIPPYPAFLKYPVSPQNDLQTMKISDAIAERGHDYYRENRVRYISLDKTHVQAIVEGTQPYELECDYIDGEIRNLVCDRFCTYACKHMFAAMLQLKETLAFIEKHYPGRFEESRYFAAVCKETLLNTAMAGRETGSIML